MHVIRALRARGIPVYALATSEAAADTGLQAGATPVRGSLSDQAALQTGMQQCDLVLHLDMLEGVALPFDELYQANVVGTQEVIKAARAAQGTRLVVASTESVLLGSGPLINVDETRPHPKKPLCDYTRVMGLVEDEALAAHSPELSTVIVRPRLIWGPGDTNSLPQLVAAVRTGAFAWIGGGYHLTSTCHVSNFCEGLLLAAEKRRGGEIYFLCDKEPVEWRAFLTAWLRTAGVEAGDRELPLWLARLVATVSARAWNTFHLKGSPPITPAAVKLVGEEITLNDTKARRELGYSSRVSREAGLAQLRELAASAGMEVSA